jgi:acetyltransferase-like isoleucine patch superfamily enzyme
VGVSPSRLGGSGRQLRKGFVGLWLSRHATRPAWQLPIVGSLRSRVIRGPGARVEVSGRLYMGDAPTYVGAVARGMAPVVELARDATLAIHGRARFGDGTKILVGPGATVSIGDDSHLDGDCRIVCAAGVSIGGGCAIAWEVLIMDTDFHRIDGRADSDAPVRLGDRVWVGVGAKILKGVTVGDGAIVAAGAVVTRDVPAGALVAGSPARVVREHVSWD